MTTRGSTGHHWSTGLRASIAGRDRREEEGQMVVAATPSHRRRTSNKRRSPTVCVVVPTFNEAANLPHVLPRIRPEYEVVVVDGHSIDGTAEIAAGLRPSARVIGQPGRGKGDALVAGFATVRSEIVVMLDADGSARVEEIPRFLEALLAGADFAKGSRFIGDGGSADITRLRRLGNRALTALVNLLFGTRYTDLCYGYNAFWARCLPELAVDAEGFEVETQLNIRAFKAGLLVTEVPSFEGTRIHGVSNLHAFRDGLRVLRTILRERLRARPPHPGRLPSASTASEAGSVRRGDRARVELRDAVRGCASGAAGSGRSTPAPRTRCRRTWTTRSRVRTRSSRGPTSRSASPRRRRTSRTRGTP